MFCRRSVAELNFTEDLDASNAAEVTRRVIPLQEPEDTAQHNDCHDASPPEHVRTRNAWPSPVCIPPGANAPEKLRCYSINLFFITYGEAMDGANARIHVAILPSIVECQCTE